MTLLPKSHKKDIMSFVKVQLSGNHLTIDLACFVCCLFVCLFFVSLFVFLFVCLCVSLPSLCFFPGDGSLTELSPFDGCQSKWLTRLFTPVVLSNMFYVHLLLGKNDLI